MPELTLSFESKEKSLDVRAFSIEEGISQLFQVSVVALSKRADLDLETLVGRAASFKVLSGVMHVTRWGRHWKGVVSYIEQLQPELSDKGLSTYSLTIVPELWLLAQRRNYRVFQHLSVPDIVDELLAEWKIAGEWLIDRGAYPRLEYRVQYGETDFAFLCRLLEDAGIAFTFPQTEAEGSRLRFCDYLATGTPHEASPIRYTDEPNQASQQEFVTEVQLSHGVRPGTVTLRDHDFRKPDFALFGKARQGAAIEARYEQYHYQPGAFLVEGGKGGGTPRADDKGVARYEEAVGTSRAERVLAESRVGKRLVSFQTNVFGLEPGMLFTIDTHPHPALAPSEQLLITDFRLEGSVVGEWTMLGKAVFAKEPSRPALLTPKPEMKGVEPAFIVGPPGEEIHTDEFGRVRVQFPWDREGKNDDNSSCWMRVSQGWAGTGFGGLNLPRVGQEVLVGFLAGDPDQPIVVGRVFNGKSQVPYKLPEHKTRSTWRSDSSPGGGGYNEILLEDAKDRELMYVQAQKNLRKLVKHDETLTVGHDRKSLVRNDLTETTQANRVEVTGQDRTEITSGNRWVDVEGNLAKRVAGDENEDTAGNQTLRVSGSQDVLIRGARREEVASDSHLAIGGERRLSVAGDDSLGVGGSLRAAAGASLSLEAGQEIVVRSGAAIVIEGTTDLTLSGPGGFIRIHPGGITIMGLMVDINSGGMAGVGIGGTPREPEAADAPAVAALVPPEAEDVGTTGLGQ